MCHVCDAKKAIENTRRLGGDDPFIEAECLFMERHLNMRLQCDEMKLLADACLETLPAGHAMRARFEALKLGANEIDTALRDCAARMIGVIKEGMPTATLDATSGKIH